jgi:hypothetical protein
LEIVISFAGLFELVAFEVKIFLPKMKQEAIDAKKEFHTTRLLLWQDISALQYDLSKMNIMPSADMQNISRQWSNVAHRLKRLEIHHNDYLFHTIGLCEYCKTAHMEVEMCTEKLLKDVNFDEDLSE